PPERAFVLLDEYDNTLKHKARSLTDSTFHDQLLALLGKAPTDAATERQYRLAVMLLSREPVTGAADWNAVAASLAGLNSPAALRGSLDGIDLALGRRASLNPDAA